MRLWVTRSQPGAARTGERLSALGHDPLVAPVLSVDRLPATVPEAAAALAFTSAAGVEAFASLSRDRRAPVFAVGDATAAAARAAGWSEVRSADGDGPALARLIASDRAGLAGEVLVPGAREPAFDLSGALARAGVPARALPLYAARTAPAPPVDAAEAMSRGELDGLLVQSPAAGRALAGYAAEDPAFASAFAPLAAFALSPACAGPLRTLFDRPPAVAARPRERDLLALTASAPPRTP